MKLKYSFETVDMGEEIISVPVGDGADQVKGVVKLNKSGYEIMEQMKQYTTEKDMVDVLESKYENDRNDLEKYVHDAIDVLRSAGLIEE